MTKRLRLVLALLGLPAALSGVAAEPGAKPTNQNVEAIAKVAAWDFQLQKVNIEHLARQTSDLVVIDYSRDGTDKGAFSRAEIDRLRKRPDGGKRLVISYLSIGEAEEYRYYWQPAWKQKRPEWLHSENCRWPENHLVLFWSQAWKDLIFSGPNSYLDRIIAAGFDGIYLDRIDVYWDYREKYPNGRALMLAFMRELAEAARRKRPDFLLIAQNAEELLSDSQYRQMIDAIAKEDLFHGVRGTGKPNEASMVSWSLRQLELLQRDRKPVFVVEYLTTADAIAASRAETSARGMLATFPTRALDGGDPLQQGALQTAVGTPEFGEKRCK